MLCLRSPLSLPALAASSSNTRCARSVAAPCWRATTNGRRASTRGKCGPSQSFASITLATRATFRGTACPHPSWRHRPGRAGAPRRPSTRARAAGSSARWGSTRWAGRTTSSARTAFSSAQPCAASPTPAPAATAAPRRGRRARTTARKYAPAAGRVSGDGFASLSLVYLTCCGVPYSPKYRVGLGRVRRIQSSRPRCHACSVGMDYAAEPGQLQPLAKGVIFAPPCTNPA